MANNNSETERRLWKVVDKIRADSDLRLSEYATPILGIIFLIYADHRFTEAEKELKDKGSEGKETDREDYQTKGVMYLPPTSRFSYLRSLPGGEDIGKAINEAMRGVEAENEDLKGILPKTYNTIDNSTLFSLLQNFSLINVDAEEDFGRIFKYFLDKIADAAGQRGSVYVTPSNISSLLVSLLKPSIGMDVYDPFVGTGSFLVEANRYVTSKYGSDTQLSLYGQERNQEAWALCKINLCLNHLDADVRLGDTIRDPQHVVDGELMQFDRVLASPPFSATHWRHDEIENDAFNRFNFGVPSSRSGDFAFIQHMIASLKPDGVMAVVVRQGVLFQRGREGKIRQAILEADLVEAVIGLPGNLFYGTGLPMAVLIINRDKPPERTGKVLFINASRSFYSVGKQSTPQPKGFSRIINTFETYSDDGRFSRVVSLDEIKENSFNLNITRYADLSELAGLLSQHYDKFEKYAIGDLALEVNSVSGGGEFKEIENAVYVPITQSGDRLSTSHLNVIYQQHDKYHQVVLNDKALSAYVAQFLGSALGQHLLEVMSQGSGVQRLSKSDLLECMIALPSLSEQQTSINTHEKLTTLKFEIDQIDSELSLNPTALDKFQDQLDSMLSVMGGLTEADEIRRVLRQGESKTVEFKSTLRWNIKAKRNDDEMTHSCLKTIAAFLNTGGGLLFIGVDDDGIPLGLDYDNFPNEDKFLLHLFNIVKQAMGDSAATLVDAKTHLINGKLICRVECSMSPPDKPVFVKFKKGDEEFFVRTGPGTTKLPPSQVFQYISDKNRMA